MPVNELYSESGVLPFSFNTINKLIWFVENKPEIVEKELHLAFHAFNILISVIRRDGK